jgi:cysteine-rich repeat protein
LHIRISATLLGLILGSLAFSSQAISAGSSSSFRFDYNRIINEAGLGQSASFNLFGAIPSASAKGVSTNFNLRNVYAGLPSAGAICGNAVIEAGEQCEGANLGGATCATYGYSLGTLQCTACMINISGCSNPGGGGGGGGGGLTVCGNSRLEAGEQCDDGNRISGDGCSSGCRIEYPICGNGIAEIGEECDDGNTKYNDGCTPLCKLEVGVPCVAPCDVSVIFCGNGIKEGNEECDDGNNYNGDGCSEFCEIEIEEKLPPSVPPSEPQLEPPSEPPSEPQLEPPSEPPSEPQLEPQPGTTLEEILSGAIEAGVINTERGDEIREMLESGDITTADELRKEILKQIELIPTPELRPAPKPELRPIPEIPPKPTSKFRIPEREEEPEVEVEFFYLSGPEEGRPFIWVLVPIIFMTIVELTYLLTKKNKKSNARKHG